MSNKSRRVEIVEKSEPLTIIKLEDGTVINMRTIVFAAHIMINEDGSPIINPDGSPMYKVNHQLAIYIDTFETVPENVKRN